MNAFKEKSRMKRKATDSHERFKHLLSERDTPEFLSPQKNLVFVYGSLKRGHHNDYVMQGAKFVCHTITKGGNFNMVCMRGGYPGVMWGTSRVVGEVYAISDLQLELLDCLEEEGISYKRHRCHVRDIDDLVWIYVLYQDFRAHIDHTEIFRIVYDESDLSMEWILQ